MSSKVGASIAIGLTMVLCVPSPSRGEDLSPNINLGCGASCDDVLARTLPNSLITAIPGGTVVFTVAHLAPSPEEAIERGKPVTCESVKFRIDTLTVKPRDGKITVELGDVQKLVAGDSTQIRFNIDPRIGVGLPTYDLDLLGFRFRSDKAFSQCNMVASGLFYPTSGTLTPTPVALIPSVARTKTP